MKRIQGARFLLAGLSRHGGSTPAIDFLSDASVAGTNGIFQTNVVTKAIVIFTAAGLLGLQLQAQVSFPLSSSPGTGNYPYSVAAADVNGDGLVDLISANKNGNTLSVLTNDGSGNFVLAASPGVGSSPFSVIAADVNGDGKIDLISANYGNNTLSVLTNDGSGNFVLAASPGVGSNPFSVVAADVNGDGLVDLISANSGNNTLSVLTNNGSGGFVLAASPGVGSAPRSVVAVDVNGDGLVDLISANIADNTLSVLTNNGSGGFVLAASLSVGSGPASVVAADVNGDGLVDLISANNGNNTLSVLTNNGSGGFGLAASPGVGSQPASVVAADVNGDGLVDLISANYADNTLSVLTNDGSGNFVIALSPSVGGGPQSVVAADLNGDGLVDLISANQFGSTLSVLTNATPFPPATVPVITAQPAGQTNQVGATASFTAAFTAAGPQQFSWQWRLAGTNLPAATNNTLVLPNLTLNQAGAYDLVIANAAGSVTSSLALLEVRFILVRVNGRPAAGTNTAVAAATVTISGGYPNGFTFYTLDGSTPTTSSLFYGGPVNLTTSAVVRALSLSADFTQTALAAPATVQITTPLNLSTPGGGNVTVNGQPVSSAPVYFLPGTGVHLAATASNGWSFLGWQGSATGTNNPLSLIIGQTNNLRGIFGTVVATNSLGGGSIVLSQPNPIPYGTSLTASAAPGPGNYFLTWGGAASGTNAPATIAVTTATPTVSALFSTLPVGKYSLSVVVNGGGSVTNNLQRSYYNPGDSVTLQAAANAGAYFLGWAQDAVGANNPLTVLVNSNKTIQANFGVLPAVSISPSNLIVLAGSNTVISAAASGLPPLTYQWYKNQGIITGATNAVLTLSSTPPAGAGNYFVVVANASGSVTSLVATVSVVGVPAITNQPQPLTVVTNGHAASFAVAASGWPALAYQWKFNGANLAGKTNPALTLSNAFPANAGAYAVVITNVYGSITSNPAMLTVLPLGITAPAMPAGGQFQFSFDTAAGVNYAVQYSTNLTQWVPFLTVGGIGAPLTLTDPSAAGSRQRFYRILLSPQ